MSSCPHDMYRVVLLSGGDSAEREISLATGRQVAHAMEQDGHKVETIDPAEVPLSEIEWNRFDVCFLALHGGEGEDGHVQQWLEEHDIAYTGSDSHASRLAMSKSAAKERFRQQRIPTADYFLVEKKESTPTIAEKVAKLGYPVIVKPDGDGSSFGLGIARNQEELLDCIDKSLPFGGKAMVERFIEGREFSVAVLGRTPLPMVEIVTDSGLFDYESKYVSSSTKFHFETGLPPITIKEMEETAVASAESLSTSGLVRVDLMLEEDGSFWVLEVNTLPGMTDHSIAPLAAKRAGMDLPTMCRWILQDGLSSR